MKKRTGMMILVALAATCRLAGQVPAHSPTNNTTALVSLTATGRAVVSVNGTVLTDKDLNREMMNVFPYAKQHGGKFPKDSEALIRAQALKNIEFEELAYQAATKQATTIPASKLSVAMKEFRAQFQSEAQYQGYLKTEQKGSEQELQNRIRRSLLIDKYLVAQIDDKARCTDAQVREFYNKHPEYFTKPDSVWLQTITIAYGQTPTAAEKEEARKNAEEALKQAKATKDYESFGVLAEKISMDDWRVMMGDHKWLHRGRMPEAVEKFVFTMEKDQISGIIDTGDSFCIARVNGREAKHLMKYDEVKTEVKQEMERRKAGELRVALDKQLRANATIEELRG
jgi:parvulin-like peptidyl-prolyl isomerase